MPNLLMLKIFIDNAKYLDPEYLAGGRKASPAEIVFQFLGMIQISKSTEVNLTSKIGEGENGLSMLDLLGLTERDFRKLRQKGIRDDGCERLHRKFSMSKQKIDCPSL
jgi:hypothetical protein